MEKQASTPVSLYREAADTPGYFLRSRHASDLVCPRPIRVAP